MPYVNEIARLSGDLSTVKDQHHDEISLINDQHNTRNARSQKQLMQLIVARDSQIKAMRGELDAMNKKVLDVVNKHALEVKNLQIFHHRRVLMANGGAGEKVIEGTRFPLPTATI